MFNSHQRYPTLAKSFKSKTDAKTWALQTELKIRREEAGILKIKYPSFKDISLRYLNDVSIHKQKTTYNLERAILNPLMQEARSEYPINKITPLINDPYWLIKPEKPEDEDTSIPIEEKIKRIAYQRKLAENKLFGLNEEFAKQKLRERMSRLFRVITPLVSKVLG